MAIFWHNQPDEENENMLYIIRHGKTDWNEEFRLQGRTDIPLNEDGRSMAREAAKKYSSLSRLILTLGCKLTAPFMTLSFMSLPVIPKLKITDKGLFDVEKFQHLDSAAIMTA